MVVAVQDIWDGYACMLSCRVLSMTVRQVPGLLVIAAMRPNDISQTPAITDSVSALPISLIDGKDVDLTCFASSPVPCASHMCAHASYPSPGSLQHQEVIRTPCCQLFPNSPMSRASPLMSPMLLIVE